VQRLSASLSEGLLRGRVFAKGGGFLCRHYIVPLLLFLWKGKRGEWRKEEKEEEVDKEVPV